MKHLKDQFFLATPINEDGMQRFVPLRLNQNVDSCVYFVSFGARGLFLTGNGSYIYKENNPSREDLYLKKWLIIYFKELGYAESFVRQHEA